MAQIAFLTLFLGLTLGPQPIELTVTGPVSVVELLLDGAPAGRLAGPPWKGQVDFGPSLVPHELVARALDAEGNEVGRVQQWVNLPRSQAEVGILLEDGANGRPAAARLTWQSLTGEKPTALRVTFDDKPLAVDAGSSFRLPAWDPETSHVLTVEVRFSGVLTARRDVVFGGRWGEQVATELTAVPVRLRPGKELPPPERMERWFQAGGRPLRVAALEEGPAELLVVRDVAAPDAFADVLTGGRRTRPKTIMGGPGLDQLRPDRRRYDMTLGQEDAVRFVWPVPKTYSGSGPTAALFDMSPDFSARDGGLLWCLARFVPRTKEPDAARQRLADAVSVAGLQALRANRRRAVLLILSETPRDASPSAPALVRHYLDMIRVPLFVWTLGEPEAPAAAAWGEATNVSSVSRMQKAFDLLKEELAAQRIVLIDGRHLPQAIGISAEAAEVIELASSRLPTSGR